MLDRFEVDDATLHVAGSLLAQAAEQVVAEGVTPPRAHVPSLTGIAEELRRFLDGTATARGALADAAVTAGVAIAEVMQAGAELESQLAAAIPGGSAVPGPARPKT